MPLSSRPRRRGLGRPIKKDTLDQLLSGRDPKDVFSKDGLFDELKKALAERVLNAELDDHFHGETARGKPNRIPAAIKSAGILL
jgi:transposase-like protein